MKKSQENYLHLFEALRVDWLKGKGLRMIQCDQTAVTTFKAIESIRI